MLIALVLTTTTTTTTTTALLQQSPTTETAVNTMLSYQHQAATATYRNFSPLTFSFRSLGINLFSADCCVLGTTVMQEMLPLWEDAEEKRVRPYEECKVG
jgi:hypothetical protein